MSIQTFLSNNNPAEILGGAQEVFGKILFYGFIIFSILLVVIPVTKFGLELLKSNRSEEDNTKQIVTKWAIRIGICIAIVGALWGLYSAIPTINDFVKP